MVTFTELMRTPLHWLKLALELPGYLPIVLHERSEPRITRCEQVKPQREPQPRGAASYMASGWGLSCVRRGKVRYKPSAGIVWFAGSNCLLVLQQHGLTVLFAQLGAAVRLSGLCFAPSVVSIAQCIPNYLQSGGLCLGMGNWRRQLSC